MFAPCSLKMSMSALEKVRFGCLLELRACVLAVLESGRYQIFQTFEAGHTLADKILVWRGNVGIQPARAVVWN